MFVDMNELQQGQKNDPNLNPIGPYSHGPNGLFNVPEGSDGVIAAFILPNQGALGTIPIVQTDPYDGDTNNGQFGAEDSLLDSIITGITSGALDTFTNQPTTDCADGPVGGLTKLCNIVNPLGRIRVGVREVSTYRAGRRESLSDRITQRLMNTPVMQQFIGTPSTTPSLAQSMANEISKRIFESVVSLQRMFAPRVWIGSPANNSGERRDIVGLDIHINAGNKVDYRTSAVCTAADSVIQNFDYELVDGGGRDIVEYIEMAEYSAVEWNGGRMGLSPIAGYIYMRPEMWREVSAAWPVRQYQSALNAMNFFGANTEGRVVVAAPNALQDRDTFRANHLLPINGRNYMVVEDENMSVDTPNQTTRLQPGQYASDIVFVPITVRGGLPATYWQYYNHNNTQSDATIRVLSDGSMTFTTDNGMIRWYVNFKNGCLNMTWEFSPRLRCRTPMVGWRITNVTVQPTLMPRSSDPASDYFADGGVTEQPANTFYTPWSPTTPTAI